MLLTCPLKFLVGEGNPRGTGREDWKPVLQQENSCYIFFVCRWAWKRKWMNSGKLMDPRKMRRRRRPDFFRKRKGNACFLRVSGSEWAETWLLRHWMPSAVRREAIRLAGLPPSNVPQDRHKPLETTLIQHRSTMLLDRPRHHAGASPTLITADNTEDLRWANSMMLDWSGRIMLSLSVVIKLHFSDRQLVKCMFLASSRRI